jgi:hypothetical protein
VIDDEDRAKVQKVINYAVKPENFYHVWSGGDTRGAMPPGDNYRHCTNLDTFRCVFSFTVDHGAGKVFRHLSISIPRKGKYPHIMAAFTIAELFGFTGWDGKTCTAMPEGWLCNIAEQDGAIVLAEEAPEIKYEAKA